MDLPDRPSAADDVPDPSGAASAQPPETPGPDTSVPQTVVPETSVDEAPSYGSANSETFYHAGPSPAVFGDDPGLEFDQPVAVVPIVSYEPSPGFEYTPPPEVPPGPPKSVVGALLLNLTGFGLGYAYLRNRVFLVIALVGTAALITIGFVAHAAQQPWVWRGVALGWLVILALHAAFLAGRRAPGASHRKPVIAGVVAVAVVVAGYVGYGIAGSSTYDRGLAAEANGDCATATDAFDAVAGVFELTLSQRVLDARDRVTECADYDKALAAQKKKDYSRAITLYEDFGKIHPHSVLDKHVHTHLADAHFAKATGWQPPINDVDAETSVNTLLMLGREFADTEAAKKAPKAIEDVFAEATKPYGAGKFCESLRVLTYFAELDASSVGQKVSADANAYRARSLYECGLSQVRENKYTDAVTNLTTFLTKYPKDGGVPQAKAALITAKVASISNVQLPFPPPLGGNDPGSISVTFYNGSNSPAMVLVAGPTAHEISLPACPTCPEAYPAPTSDACGNYSGLPSVTLHLPSNTTYYYATDDPDKYQQATDSVTLNPGYDYLECVYVTSG